MEGDVDLEAGMNISDVHDPGPLCDLLWMDLETEIDGGVNDSDVQCFLREHGAHLVDHAHRVVDDDSGTEQSEEN
eukprot:9751690-Alexandrium_andersonii.AAC.1